MKNHDLKKVSVNELQNELLALFREQFNLRMQKATHQLSQTHLLKQVRRKIAVIKTLLQVKAS